MLVHEYKSGFMSGFINTRSTFTNKIHQLSDLSTNLFCQANSLLLRSSGYPDTERFKILNSVSNQNHGCVEDDGGEVTQRLAYSRVIGRRSFSLTFDF